MVRFGTQYFNMIQERNIINGATAAMVAPLLDFYSKLIPFILLAIILIIVDSRFGCAASRKRGEEIRTSRKWIEMFFAGWVIMFILQLIFDISAWWYILPLFSFYIWYVLEWFFKSLFKLKNAYKDISFEKEAKASENDNCYLENMGYFEWFKYYGKNF